MLFRLSYTGHNITHFIDYNVLLSTSNFGRA